jgi:predicted transcriptional regulator
VKTVAVKELMVPLSEYATVSENDMLYDAVQVLKKAQNNYDPEKHRHRAVLVQDANNNVVGKLGQIEILKALEPKYAEIGDLNTLSRAGFSPSFLKAMIEKFALWDKPLDVICDKASRVKVKDIMHTPTPGEYIQEDATLGQLIHQILMGRHQSLLVTRGSEIVGIVRLVDVFNRIGIEIDRCKI